MHDILEGCLQYDLKVVLHQLIVVDKLVSLEELNNRVQSFAYGVDSKNKPQPISVDRLQGTQKKLGMNASQAWCFARYFCLFVGDLVPTDYYCLQLIFILLDIVDIIFAPSVTVSMTYRLEELIFQHHKLFREFFPIHTLIPKQHFLIHYPSKIRQLGPCVQYWCMRFESKHAAAKDFSRMCHSFKNICKSIAWKQQIKLCVDWMTLDQSAKVDVGTGSALLPCTLSVPDFVFEDAGIPLYEESYFTNYVKVNGSKYMPLCLVMSLFWLSKITCQSSE